MTTSIPSPAPPFMEGNVLQKVCRVHFCPGCFLKDMQDALR
eukprot:CAMPEP_0113303132 /NCGR_PEP_ID=MMETSP0010_2-20120614/3675_1 /TAXON_ID=216773 ORGANISM="Corethron hystrix, Strain 308" /NCGR_SAMPLE_ID=MMETSP0010_2 /ASSEMBLY_ACC=CAM_ASM_000155 /LENGTH=40 /DNA_ID=CAMNT_0000157077 /DNA_START=36 /DNA_END=155 /DNA_ORIENTATION=- /assembly_acc=CAM_ASM_000155